MKALGKTESTKAQQAKVQPGKTKALEKEIKQSKKASAMDNLFDQLTELSKDCILTKYDGDYVFQKKEKIFAFSDFILGKTQEIEDASSIVMSCLIRHKIRVANQLVIPQVPIKGMWNVVNNISSAVSHIQTYTTSINDIIKNVQEEVGDWNSIIYRKGNAIPTSEILGFSIQPGRLSPTWIPALQAMALAPVSETESIQAYQIIFGHMFYNQEKFVTMSIKEAEMIRAGALLETLCTSPQGTMKYCMALKHAANSLNHHVQAVIKTAHPSASRKQVVQPKFSRGRNPYVSYANKGTMASERLEDIIKQKNKDKKQTIKSKYKGLGDYERQQISDLFSQTSRCSMPDGLKIHSFKLNTISMSADAKKTAFRVNIPTILKSQSGYYTYSMESGFGDLIKSVNMNPSMFTDKVITEGQPDGLRNIYRIKETVKNSEEKVYGYTVMNDAKHLEVVGQYYDKLGDPEVMQKIALRKKVRHEKYTLKKQKKKEEKEEKERESSEESEDEDQDSDQESEDIKKDEVVAPISA